MTAQTTALLIAPGIIWGASFLFMAEGLNAIGPGGVTFVRILVGFLTLGLLPSARKSIAASDRAGVTLLGLIWIAFPLTLFPIAEQRVSSALTGMLNGANPLFTAIVASVIARHLPGRRLLNGLAVGLAGTVLIAWPSLREGGNSVDGVLLILAAVISYAFALNLARGLQQRNGALPVIWRAQAVALILTAPLGVPDLFEARWTLTALLALLALGALGTGVAYALLAVASGRVGATRASATAFIIPPVALFLGVAVRGETVAWMSVAGCLVSLAGAWMLRQGQRTPPRPVEA